MMGDCAIPDRTYVQRQPVCPIENDGLLTPETDLEGISGNRGVALFHLQGLDGRKAFF
jgi:hypothetical protein